MKRSKSVKLVLMAGGAGLASCSEGAVAPDVPRVPDFASAQECADTDIFTASYCQSLTAQTREVPAEAYAYGTVEACSEGDVFTMSYCRKQYEEAQNIHASSGPRYVTQGVCEEEHGFEACTQQASGGNNVGSYWSPFLTGYFISSAINSFTRPSPYYRNRYGGFSDLGGNYYSSLRSGSGYRFTDSQYRANTAAASRQAPVKTRQMVRNSPQRTTVARRGGFGGRSGGRGG